MFGNIMLFELVPGGFSFLMKLEQLDRIQIGKNYWDLETCRKSQKKYFSSDQKKVT